MDEWDDVGKKLWADVSNSVTTDTTPLKIALKNVGRNEYRSELDSNKRPREIREKINSLKPIDTAKEVQAIRSGILKEIRSDSAGLVPERARVAKLNKLQGPALDMLQRGSGGNAYRIARQHTYIQHELFSRGIVGDITSLKTTGADRIMPTGTIAAILSGRNKIDNLRKIKLGIGDEIEEPLQDFMEAQFVRKVFPQG